MRPCRLIVLVGLLVSISWAESAAAENSAFVHTATADTMGFSWTHLHHPQLNGEPDAIILVTHNMTPGGAVPVYDDHTIGVWYNSLESRWAIFHQDGTAVPLGASFNVEVATSDPKAFVHTATAGDIEDNTTWLDHPLLNFQPNAIVLVTQNWNPGGTGGVDNDHEIGVWYSGTESKWGIFNQDNAIMPEGASFNVQIVTTTYWSTVHTTSSSTIVGAFTVLDYPLLTYHPEAIILATPNWNPGGVGGAHHDHTIGTYFITSSHWLLFNQDNALMPEGVSFNLLVLEADFVFFDDFESGNTSSWSGTVP